MSYPKMSISDGPEWREPKEGETCYLILDWDCNKFNVGLGVFKSLEEAVKNAKESNFSFPICLYEVKSMKKIHIGAP